MPSASCGLHHTYLLITVITNSFLHGNNRSHYNCCQNPLAPKVLLEWKPEGMWEPPQLQRQLSRSASWVWAAQGGKATKLSRRKITLCFRCTRRITPGALYQPEVASASAWALQTSPAMCGDTFSDVFVHRDVALLCVLIFAQCFSTPWGPGSLQEG